MRSMRSLETDLFHGFARNWTSTDTLDKGYSSSTLRNSVWDLHGPLHFNISFGINIITSGFIVFCFA